MNRLKNYKRLKTTDEDTAYAREEFSKVIGKYEQNFQEKLVELLLQTYQNSILEIERRQLLERGKLHPPRMDYYLKYMLSFSLNKLHKGDILKAYELLEEIRDKVFKLKNQ